MGRLFGELLPVSIWEHREVTARWPACQHHALPPVIVLSFGAGRTTEALAVTGIERASVRHQLCAPGEGADLGSRLSGPDADSQLYPPHQMDTQGERMRCIDDNGVGFGIV